MKGVSRDTQLGKGVVALTESYMIPLVFSWIFFLLLFHVSVISVRDSSMLQVIVLACCGRWKIMLVAS